MIFQLNLEREKLMFDIQFFEKSVRILMTDEDLNTITLQMSRLHFDVIRQVLINRGDGPLQRRLKEMDNKKQVELERRIARIEQTLARIYDGLPEFIRNSVGNQRTEWDNETVYDNIVNMRKDAKETERGYK